MPDSAVPPRIVWIHNFATHYTVRLFELVSRRLQAHFLFYSQGRERYWLQENGVQRGDFSAEVLPGFQAFGTRVTPLLPLRLWRTRCDAIVQCIDGKFALPVSYLMARLMRKPFILYTGIWMRVNTPLHRLAFPFIRHIYRNASALVVYGEHVKRYLLQEGVPEERIFVETHAVDNRLYRRPVMMGERENVRRALGITRNEKIILYLGRIEPEKGLDHLVRAFASLPDPAAVLVLAGSGSAEGHLRALAERLGVGDRVLFPGYISLTGTPAYYAIAKVFVLPSVTTKRDKEAWGLVVNEAFNQSLPVIATDAVGAAAGGLVEDGVNGYIVPEASPEHLAGALLRMLSDEQKRLEMGEAAARKVDSWNQEGAAEVVERAVRFATGRPAAAPAAPPDPSGVFLVIPVHNRRAFTWSCLAALARQTVSGFRVAVVDDGSTDGTAEMVRSEFPGVQVLRGDGSLWWSGSTNLGVAAARRCGATHIMTLNDDTVPPPNFVENMLSAAACRPGALIGAYAVDAGTGQPVYGGEWVRWSTASSRSLLSDREAPATRLVETTHYPGRGLLIPAGVFDQIGLFDAVHFPQAAADYDFTLRARRAGYRIYCDTASVLGIHPGESGDAAIRRHKGWRNYGRHLFDIKGGGNLRVFFWYAVKNCPVALLPLCLAVGFVRRTGGYLLEWIWESQ